MGSSDSHRSALPGLASRHPQVEYAGLLLGTQQAAWQLLARGRPQRSQGQLWSNGRAAVSDSADILGSKSGICVPEVKAVTVCAKNTLGPASVPIHR